jgi:uncharacterized DUF497 family protein
LKIVWDEPKRLANLAKHGLDFADLNETFFDKALVLPSHNKRWAGIGKKYPRCDRSGVRHLG